MLQEYDACVAQKPCVPSGTLLIRRGWRRDRASNARPYVVTQIHLSRD